MMRDMIAATPAEGYAALLRGHRRVGLRADLRRITAPTLVISGAEDPATPPEHGRVLADGIPGARFEVVDRRRPPRVLPAARGRHPAAGRAPEGLELNEARREDG